MIINQKLVIFWKLSINHKHHQPFSETSCPITTMLIIINDTECIILFNLTLFHNLFKVPGRMGLLITSSLISWNVYGSTKAPPSRGFSYIEVWISGVQTNIIGAICEYSCILAIRRTKLTLSIKSTDMDKIITLIDFGAFVISFIYFTMFNLVYWFGTH